MSQTIVYIDTSTIREGKLAELEVAMENLAAFVNANVPQLISYGFFLDRDRTQMTVVAVHADSASLEFHMDTCDAEFRRFASLIDLSKIEVYGRISDAALERLHHKAQMLGRGTVWCMTSTQGSLAEGAQRGPLRVWDARPPRT